jgi:hypothetical protein
MSRTGRRDREQRFGQQQTAEQNQKRIDRRRKAGQGAEDKAPEVPADDGCKRAELLEAFSHQDSTLP